MSEKLLSGKFEKHQARMSRKSLRQSGRSTYSKWVILVPRRPPLLHENKSNNPSRASGTPRAVASSVKRCVESAQAPDLTQVSRVGDKQRVSTTQRPEPAANADWLRRARQRTEAKQIAIGHDAPKRDTPGFPVIRARWTRIGPPEAPKWSNQHVWPREGAVVTRNVADP